jgi:hypothetical protein
MDVDRLEADLAALSARDEFSGTVLRTQDPTRIRRRGCT